MNQKKLLKTAMLFLALTSGTIIYLYARDGHFFKRSKEVENPREKPIDENADDIGVPTGEDPWQEMNKLVKSYYNEKGISFKGTIRLIDDNGEKEKVLQESAFEYASFNGEFSYHLSKMEVVYKKNMLLVADHANKLIAVSPADTKGNPVPSFDILQFKELMEDQKAEAQVTRSGDQNILTIDKINDPQVSGYRIYYDTATYSISKILIGMIRFAPLDNGEEGGIDEVSEEAGADEKKTENKEENPGAEGVDTYTYYLEMIYTEAKVLNLKAGSFHPENKFIVVNNKQIELTPAYKGYQLNKNTGQEKDTQDDSEK